MRLANHIGQGDVDGIGGAGEMSKVGGRFKENPGLVSVERKTVTQKQSTHRLRLLFYVTQLRCDILVERDNTKLSVVSILLKLGYERSNGDKCDVQRKQERTEY